MPRPEPHAALLIWPVLRKSHNLNHDQVNTNKMLQMATHWMLQWMQQLSMRCLANQLQQ